MNSIILLPFLLSKVLSFAIYNPGNMLLQAPHQINNPNNPIKLCFVVKYTTNNLQEISIPKTTNETNLIDFLIVMEQNKTIENPDIQAFVITKSSKACAVEIYKNETSNLYVFDHKIVPLATCNNPKNSQIICDIGSNCTNAIKCCDLTNFVCINTFALKKIMPNKTQYNNNINSCATANNTNCFSIVQMYNFTKSADIIADSTTEAPSHNTTTVPVNSQQSVNITFLQLMYFSIASLLAGL